MAATARGASAFGGGGQATQGTWFIMADWRLPSKGLPPPEAIAFSEAAAGAAQRTPPTAAARHPPFEGASPRKGGALRLGRESPFATGAGGYGLNSPLSFFFTATFLSRTYCGMPCL